MAHYDGPAFYRRPQQNHEKVSQPQPKSVANRPVPVADATHSSTSTEPTRVAAAPEDYTPINRLHPFVYSDHQADPNMVAAFHKSAAAYYLIGSQEEDKQDEVTPVESDDTGVTETSGDHTEAPIDTIPHEVDQSVSIAPGDEAQPAADASVDESEPANAVEPDHEQAESDDSRDVETSEPDSFDLPEDTNVDDESVAAFHMPDSILQKALGQTVAASASSAVDSDKLHAKQDVTSPDLENDKPASSNAPIRTTNYDQYQLPDTDLLQPVAKTDMASQEEWVTDQTGQLNTTLQAFHVKGQVVHHTVGPTVTQFEIQLAPGVKVSKVTALQDDLKLALAAAEIRIEAPIPGKRTVGIEIPNAHPRSVALKEIVGSTAFAQSLSPLTIALGIDLFGRPVVGDLRKMPHGLIAGSTGSGKSVFINGILLSLLLKASPDQLQLLLIDPKAVELAPYNNLPHLLAPVISDPEEAVAALDWVVERMEQRYTQLVAAGVRNIEEFNQRAKAQHEPEMQMPYIVVVIDELADLMMTTANAVQDSIARLTQKARAAGIHLLIATQRPSVDVLTGVIKNNIPTRIAFMVSSQVDSRTILDSQGAERLLGKGDMLYRANGSNHPLRIQGAYVTSAEIDRVTAAITAQAGADYVFTNRDLKKAATVTEEEDPLWEQVLDYVQHEDAISTSKLQRLFSIGYNRAANLIDHLEAQNYVSGPRGSKPRKVFYQGTKDNGAAPQSDSEEKE
jgi:S-DNA-T family DNA segregation ATPase FtsK/SpoIIIE